MEHETNRRIRIRIEDDDAWMMETTWSRENGQVNRKEGMSLAHHMTRDLQKATSFTRGSSAIPK